MSTTGSDLADRYGTAPGRRRRRAGYAAGALGLAAALGWVVWAGLGQARADVRWNDVGFAIHGDSSVEVTYDVGKDPAKTAVCTLQALDASKGTVGLAQVTIGPRPQQVTRNVGTVRTSALAVTGIVRDCRLQP